MKSIWRRQAAGISAIVLAGAWGCAGQSGAEGTQGEDGAVALLNISEIEAGGTCAVGGTRVESGLDLDGDGVLSAGEVTATSNICEGSDGADGMDGVDGADGMDGTDGIDGDSLDPCAGATQLEITSFSGIGATYFRGFDSAPITINTTSNRQIEVSFVTNAFDFREGGAAGEYVFTPAIVGEDFRVVAVVTDGCTIDTESFTIASVERAVADVRFVHLFDGAQEIEVTPNGQVDPIALLGFEDSSDVEEVEAGTFSYDIVDLDTGSIIATTPQFMLDPGTSNTILMYRELGNVAFTNIVDDVSPVAALDMRLRVFHGADGVGQIDALIDSVGAYGPLVEDVDPNTSSTALNTGAPGSSVLFGLDTDDDGGVDLNFQGPVLEGGDNVNVFAYLDGARPKLYIQFISNLTSSEDVSTFSYNGSIEVGPGDELSPAVGASLTLTGTLDASDATWARPSSSCFSSSGRMHYDAIPLTNATQAPQTLDITATWPDFDGFLHVFANAPDPASPTRSCITGNDDSGGTGNSEISGFDLAPGQRVWIIASTYDDDDTGAWSIDVAAR